LATIYEKSGVDREESRSPEQYILKLNSNPNQIQFKKNTNQAPETNTELKPPSNKSSGRLRNSRIVQNNSDYIEDA